MIKYVFLAVLILLFSFQYPHVLSIGCVAYSFYKLGRSYYHNITEIKRHVKNLSIFESTDDSKE